jgi:DNA-binding beta-propeller fold protein YncE
MSTHIKEQIGTEFLGYRIEELIGQGGMGVVYRAYDLRLKRTVALKLVAPDLALDERFRERFSRESELAMSLEHPNVVPIHDAGDLDGRLYLAMRYVEGTDVSALLRAEGALDPGRALAIAGQIGNALDAAHARGLVHRDVKPSNVLLDQREHVYLADFGLTRRLEEQGVRPAEGRSMGTPAYLAPEQIEGQPIDSRSDVYSLGCLLFECLTGDVPFSRDSRLGVAWAHLEEPPPSASERKPGLPGAIDAVIRKAMAKEPENRYPTCAELIMASEEALGLKPPILRRRRVLLLVAAAVLVTLAAALAAALATRGDGRAAGSGLVGRADTLVHIDPATNDLSAVLDVGQKPSATAVGGRSVWVYNQDDGTVSEIDGPTNALRHTTWPDAQPFNIGASAGPVLAADAGGAWIIGVDKGSSILTRILRGGRGVHEYRLDHEPAAVAAGPEAVAVGEDAVWVLDRSTGDRRQVLRIDPATGQVTARTRFPGSSRIDSLAVGEGAVWVVDSSRAKLYRIDPHIAKVTWSRDLGTHATGPVVAFGSVWVQVTDFGGDTLLVDPRTLVLNDWTSFPSDQGHYASGYGSVWWADVPTGTVVRFNGLGRGSLTYASQVASTIRVTEALSSGGLCMTSIAAGAGAVWVTVGGRPTGPSCAENPHG